MSWGSRRLLAVYADEEKEVQVTEDMSSAIHFSSVDESLISQSSKESLDFLAAEIEKGVPTFYIQARMRDFLPDEAYDRTR